MNYVTIASDASCGVRKTYNGFAYYIRDDSGTTARAWREKRKGGTTNADMTNSTVAEVHAMLGAFKAIKDRRYVGDTTLIYYCDSRQALEVLSGEFFNFKKKSKQQEYGSAYVAIQKIAHDMGVTRIEARWVRGHVDAGTFGVEEKRYYMNRWCDHNSHMMMKSGHYDFNYKEIK